MSISRLFARGLLLSLGFVAGAASQSSQTVKSEPVLMRTLQQELARAMSSLGKADPVPYFISYSVNDEFNTTIIAGNGAIVANMNRHERIGSITVRVGGRDLDNTHGEGRFNAVINAQLPLDDQPDAIARVLWFNTDRMYKKASQAMELARSETFDGAAFENLPSDEVITGKIEKIAADLKKLKTAPVVEPFTGPALLSGRAAAVFFHEVVGHRLEGQRQRGENEGQTFTRKIDQPVLPSFLSVEDDPTLAQLGGTELSGNYSFDEEGQ